MIVVGLNHRTVPLEVLERASVGPALLPKALHDVTARDGVGEAVVLSTCHRTEVYATAERFHAAAQQIRDFLAEWGGVAPESLTDHLYTYHDDAAVGHLFGVVAGLDSVVLGESEIVSQVRAAWETSRREGASGGQLATLFRAALEAGKRARTETAIARNITSVSQAAVAMAGKRLGGLAGRRIVVLGAGEIGERTVIALSGAGVTEILVANRTRSRAAALAARVGGRGIPLDELPGALAGADVLVTCTGATTFVLSADDLELVAAERRGRELLVVDVALPRDVDPAASHVDGITLLDLDDLKRFVAVGLDGRRREVARVRDILAEEVERFHATSAARTVAPAIVDLRARAEAIRAAELERFRTRFESLDEREREAVDAVTKAIVAKLLHEPTVRLKAAAGDASAARLADALRALFDLE